MEERRSARIGTVSGLALLLGGTATAAVAGGAHSVSATVMLGMLAAGLGHSLVVEIRRQARRGGSPARWAAHDTINTTLLATWSVAALGVAVLTALPAPVRAVGLALSFGYALSCAYFVTQRRRTTSSRTLAAGPVGTDHPRAAPPTGRATEPGATPDTRTQAGGHPGNRPGD